MKNNNLGIISKVLLTILFLIVGYYGSLILNYFVIQEIIIPDSHAYAIGDKEAGTVFNLFYDISSNSGYHPEPSFFNFFITASIGIVTALLLSYKFLWRKKTTEFAVNPK